MALPLAAMIATNFFIDPIVGVLHGVLNGIFGVVHNYGWSLIILAAIVKLVFWPLNTMQFKAMKKTQEIAPQLKALQARFKNDKEKLNEATMALYKETGANPLASCAPLLLQMPILISLYWAVISSKAQYETQGWLWIGSAFAVGSPYHILAANLAAVDYVLLACYVVSMYFQVRLSSPALDPAQAQQQKIMAFVSPAMVAYLGVKFHWPSALIIYWLAFNCFTMGQQFFLMRKYRTTPLLATAAAAPPMKSLSNGVPATEKALTTNGTPGARSNRKRRSSRR